MHAHRCDMWDISQAQGGRPRPSPAVVGDGVQIFVKPPRRRASAAGDDAALPEQPPAKVGKQPKGRDTEPPDPQSKPRTSSQPLVLHDPDLRRGQYEYVVWPHDVGLVHCSRRSRCSRRQIGRWKNGERMTTLLVASSQQLTATKLRGVRMRIGSHFSSVRCAEERWDLIP